MWINLKQEEDMSYRFIWKTSSGSGQNGQCYIQATNKFMDTRKAEAEWWSTRENLELKITWISQSIVSIPLNCPPSLFDKSYLINWVEPNFLPDLWGIFTLIQYPSVPQHYVFLSSVRSGCILYLFQALSHEIFFFHFYRTK